MKSINKISYRILELELEIKLFEYLKDTKIIDSGMYNYSIEKMLNKIAIEKSKIT